MAAEAGLQLLQGVLPAAGQAEVRVRRVCQLLQVAKALQTEPHSCQASVVLFSWSPQLGSQGTATALGFVRVHGEGCGSGHGSGGGVSWFEIRAAGRTTFLTSNH